MPFTSEQRRTFLNSLLQLGLFDEEGAAPVAEAATVEGYTAERGGDGLWSIRDVPVFSVHIDRRDGNEDHYTLAWLQGAVADGDRREQGDGYLPPLHVHHHPNPDVSHAGKFRLTGVRNLIYEGVPTPTIFADFLEIPQEVYEEVKEGRLAYRSVEIHGPEEPQILSIALLDHEVPYFRYANMRIAKETHSKKKKQLVSCYAYQLDGDKNRQVVFCYPSGSGSCCGTRGALRFTALEEDVTQLRTPALQRIYDAAAAASTTPPAPGGQITPMADPQAEVKKADDAPKMLEAALAALGALQEALAGLAEALSGEPTEEEADGDVMGEPPVAASQNSPAEIRTVEIGNAPADGQAQLSTLLGEMAAMKRQLANYQEDNQEQQQQSSLETEAAALVAAGAPPPDVKEFVELAAGQGGIGAARAFAASMKRTYLARPAAPPTFAAGELAAPSVPPEVEAFRAEGPEKYQKALTHYQIWQGGSRMHKLGTYLDAQLNESKFLSAVNGGDTNRR